jgi:6-methylsalicylate decarboxylase
MSTHPHSPKASPVSIVPQLLAPIPAHPSKPPALEAGGGDPSGWYIPSWSVEADKDLSKNVGNKTAMLSVTAAGPCIEKDAAQAAHLARQLNDYVAGLRDDDPRGYGFFGSVASPLDTAACLAEIAYMLDVLARRRRDALHALRARQPTTWATRTSGPIWAELSRRNAVVFVHPTPPGPTRD